MIFKANDKQIECYDYYVTNALVLKFRDMEDKNTIEDFFENLGDITYFDIIDETTEKIKAHHQMDLSFTRYSVENTEIIEYEYKTIQEAWDEEVPVEPAPEEGTDESQDGEETSGEGETQIIHHEAIIAKVEKKVPAEITSVFMEKPSVEMSVSSVKQEVANMKSDMQSSVTNTSDFNSFVHIVCDSFTDEQALVCKNLYDTWESIPEGAELKEGKRLLYATNNTLYKVKETHNKQSTWNPVDAPNQFTAIEPDHTGTLEDPIPAHVNMTYYKDKYYIEDGVIYLCNSELAKDGLLLQYTPSQTIDIYFEKIG